MATTLSVYRRDRPPVLLLLEGWGKRGGFAAFFPTPDQIGHQAPPCRSAGSRGVAENQVSTDNHAGIQKFYPKNIDSYGLFKFI